MTDTTQKKLTFTLRHGEIPKEISLAMVARAQKKPFVWLRSQRGYSYLGIEPLLTLVSQHGRSQLHVGSDSREEVEEFGSLNPYALLAQLLERLDVAGDVCLPFTAGLMGFLSYDSARHIEAMTSQKIDEPIPELYWMLPRYILWEDHDRQKNGVVEIVRKEHFHPFSTDMIPPFLIRSVCEDLSKKWRPHLTKANYLTQLGRIGEYIRQGDCYQVNFSQRFQAPFPRDRGLDLFDHLFQRNPADFFAYVHGGDFDILSTSPERLVRRRNCSVISSPIKGTAPRGRSAAEDGVLQEQLVKSPKEDAELSMIVDLVRNDLSKVCEPGSVHVRLHKELQSFANVHHLVSTVEGRLQEGRSSAELLMALFPGGSITGCPKIRAMEIINELEEGARGIYTGSIGYISTHETMELNIAIRTAAIVHDTMYLSVGGGIIHDSDPEAEYQESLAKGESFFSGSSGVLFSLEEKK